ncbi:BnaA09g02170D [Brassica napus]|uniref:BnaA09g02170D protein n=1 Tax=Brassica napus TaxID=3708 RepID=A0A078G3S6_BRANA|nr:BnaA09g02170D [Brassica napus]
MDYVQTHGKGHWNRIVRKTEHRRLIQDLESNHAILLQSYASGPHVSRCVQSPNVLLQMKPESFIAISIGSPIPIRHCNQVKNHWNTHLSKKFVGDYSSGVKTTGENKASLLLATASSRQHQQDKICDKSFDGLVPASYENKPNADLTHRNVVVGNTNDPSLYFKERNIFDSSNAFWFNEDEFELMSSLAMMDFASGDIGY